MKPFAVMPIPGSACTDVARIRGITLDAGSGTFVSTFTDDRCPLGDGGASSSTGR